MEKAISNVENCVICYEPIKCPIGRLKICQHSFCFDCINNWVQNLSVCPLCKRSTRCIIKIDDDGTETKIRVKKRTEQQYENDLSDIEAVNTQDITVINARCMVCGCSDNEHLLLLCDGIVGYSLNDDPVRCNAAYHSYCTEENYDIVPEGDWFCPFCRNAQSETRYTTRRSFFQWVRTEYGSDTDLPGPSRSARRRMREAFIDDLNRNANYVDGDTGHPNYRNTRSSRRIESDESSTEDLEDKNNFDTHSEDSSDSEESDRKHNALNDILANVFEMSGVDNVIFNNEENQDSDDSFVVDDDVIEDSDRSYSEENEDLEWDEMSSGNNSYNNGKGEEFECENYSDVEKENWNESDRFVLAEGSNSIRICSSGRTNVQHERRRRKRGKRNQARKRRGTQTNEIRKSNRRARKSRKRSRTHARKRKRPSEQKRRITKNGSCSNGVQENRKSQRKIRVADRSIFGSSSLSICGKRFVDSPENIEDPVNANNESAGPVQDLSKFDVDLLESIFSEQIKTLTSAKNQRIARDGTITVVNCLDDKEDRKESLISSKSYNSVNKMVQAEQSKTTKLCGGIRKNRPSRWGSPTTSSQQLNITAAIPLPSGQPLQQNVSLDSIPIPHHASLHSSLPPNLIHGTKPSVVKSSPSQSFPMNSFASTVQPFASYLQQTNLPSQQLPHLSTAGVNQQQLLQMPPLFSNLFVQPSLNVNNILAANLLANSAIAPPITQGNPFLLNQVQQLVNPNQIGHLTNPNSLGQQLLAQNSLNQHLSYANHSAQLSAQSFSSESNRNKLNSHIAVLTSTQSGAIIQGSSLSVSGVPPPPPTNDLGNADITESVCEPLAEKIRLLTHARSLSDVNKDSVEKRISTDDPRVNASSRKSASAEDEETGEASVKKHKNGWMFEQARQMLSESLKKRYRQKQIKKEEYKIIMKKGVSALSKRTRLDQQKVDEYADKYVECMIHRRKKKLKFRDKNHFICQKSDKISTISKFYKKLTNTSVVI